MTVRAGTLGGITGISNSVKCQSLLSFKASEEALVDIPTNYSFDLFARLQIYS